MAELVFVHGLPELKAKLEALPATIATRVLRSAVLAGANVIKEEAIRKAPTGPARRGISPPGTLKAAAVVKFASQESNATQVEYLVTFRKGKAQRKHGRDAYYASWVEFGHLMVPRSARAETLAGVLRNRRTLRSRRAKAQTSGKRVEPHPFLGPAFEDAKQRALDAIVAQLAAGIAKAAA